MSPARAPRVPAKRVAAAAAAGLLIGVGVLFARMLLPDGSVPVMREGEVWKPVAGRFAGDASCRGCHPGEFDQHAVSAHARTLRRLTAGTDLPHANGQPVTDPLTGATYTVEPSARGPLLRLASGATRVEAPLGWEFGSGEHARGYLVDVHGQWVDCRLNWYRQIDGWDFASGQDKPTGTLLEQPLGRPLPPGEVARCFGCHTTQLWAKGATAAGVPGDALQLRLGRTVAGVGCESCHGPRAEHVAEARRGRPRSPGPMSAAAMNALCGRCHSDPDVRPDSEVVARFQPWGLEKSVCYQRSEGKLSCKTCHDPHADAVPDVTYYDGKCLGCHSGAPASTTVALGGVCPVNPKKDCVSCHMRRDSEAMLHMTFTDHRIRILEEMRPTGKRRP